MDNELFEIETEIIESKSITKQKPAAYVNWEIANAKGKCLLKSDRGLTIWPYDPESEYKSESERQLVDVAKANGGMLEITMKARIVIPGMLRESRDPKELLAEMMEE